MSSPPGHYDENLLASAPVATKAQIQGGYNTDILLSNRAQQTPPPSGRRDVEAGLVSSSQERLGSKERFTSKDYVPAPPAKVPFWHSTKGKVIMAIVAIVIIAAVIGGAVGGTRHKNNKFSSGNEESGGTNTTSGDSSSVLHTTVSSTSGTTQNSESTGSPSAITQGSAPTGTGSVLPTLGVASQVDRSTDSAAPAASQTTATDQQSNNQESDGSPGSTDASLGEITNLAN